MFRHNLYSHDTVPIKIKRGLDIPLQGWATHCLTDLRYEPLYAVKPTDYVALQPRLKVAEGDSVRHGDELFCDKHDERIRFTSPVDGVVRSIVRGERRALQAVVVERASDASFTQPRWANLPLRDAMLDCGLWTALRQRPFGIVPSPDDSPKAIFISCFDSAPLAPDFAFVMAGREHLFVEGVRALSSLTEGCVHLSFSSDKQVSTLLLNACMAVERVKIHYFQGPHPAGNVGTQIASLDPINKGEKVWTIPYQEVATLGRLASEGCYCPERMIAFVGPVARHPQYYRLYAGASVASMAESQLANTNYPALQIQHSARLISGNVLSGTQIDADGFLGANDAMITAIEEGDQYDFMGWLMPGFDKFSFSRTFLSGLHSQVAKLLPLSFNTNLHGGVRPLVFTGNFERVFPFNIYPMQLIKAAIIGDIELMEKLGIYEVEPEDLALCEFIDPSKTEIQSVIRGALEQCRKEQL